MVAAPRQPVSVHQIWLFWATWAQCMKQALLLDPTFPVDIPLHLAPASLEMTSHLFGCSSGLQSQIWHIP